MDGNFTLSPKGFMQLFVIRIQINSIFVILFLLITYKTEVYIKRMPILPQFLSNFIKINIILTNEFK